MTILKPKDIRQRLFALQDVKYKAFHSTLIPSVEPDNIIGIQIPKLRKLAARLQKEGDITPFLNDLPHKYYEENNLHAFLIEHITDFDECIGRVNEFLPFVDNWATCDSLRPKVFKKHTDRLMDNINVWLESSHTYTVRFGIEMLMVHYLDGNFDEVLLDTVAAIKSDEYYVNMMIAWYFATALAKQWGSMVSVLETYKLPKWVHNKTIQKAVESYRITAEQKVYLKTLKLN